MELVYVYMRVHVCRSEYKTDPSGGWAKRFCVCVCASAIHGGRAPSPQHTHTHIHINPNKPLNTTCAASYEAWKGVVVGENSPALLTKLSGLLLPPTANDGGKEGEGKGKGLPTLARACAVACAVAGEGAETGCVVRRGCGLVGLWMDRRIVDWIVAIHTHS